jgi:hypothetical protein
VEGVPPDTYLERFAWNEAKYPPRRPLKETVAAITETAQKLEDELKARARACAARSVCAGLASAKCSLTAQISMERTTGVACTCSL